MALRLPHKFERIAIGKALDAAIKNVQKGDRSKNLIKIVDMAQKILGDAWAPGAYEALRNVFRDPDSKWMKYADNMLDNTDAKILKMALLNTGYEAGFRGFHKTLENGKKYDCSIPWIVLIDPTSACNLKCTGCWAAEYGHQMNISYEDLDRVITEGEQLGIHQWLFTGGEPLIRKKDIIKLCEKHQECEFQCFTNGTLIDEQFCKDMLRVGNFVPSISVEGFEDVNDDRRGQGVFQKVMHAMDLLHEHRLLFGTSICYTSKNYQTVTSDEFLDMLISKGVSYTWYFHYMPVGNDASTELLLTPEQREYMYHRVREIRSFDGGKPIMAVDFQNDGEFVHGCIAGGKYYCHINPRGDVEPCVFIHYSQANIHDKSLLECLKQPLFKRYQEGQAFNDNMLRPCPMLENPEELRKIIADTGAESTDLESPESVEHLCAKCDKYAEHWAPMADKLWNEAHFERTDRDPMK